MVSWLDDHYLEMSYEIPALEKLPSRYVRGQFYFTTYPLGHVADNPEYVAYMIEMIGPDRVMYSADIPHPDFDPPEKLFDRIKGYFDEKDDREHHWRNRRGIRTRRRSDGVRSATRHRIAATDELSEAGERVIADVDGQEVLVFKFSREYHVVANNCVHQAGPLCEGELTSDMVLGEDGWSWDYTDEEKYVRYPWHGWVFDITTGENTDDSRYRVPTDDVEVEDGTLYIVR